MKIHERSIWSFQQDKPHHEGKIMIEPVFDGGYIRYHTRERGHEIMAVSEHRIEGDEYVTTSVVGELRLPRRFFHDGGHGSLLFFGEPNSTTQERNRLWREFVLAHCPSLYTFPEQDPKE